MTLFDAAKCKMMVKSIKVNGEEGDYTITKDEYSSLYIQEEYMGDRSEIWVIRIDPNRVEIERYNTRYIASIIWA